MQSVEDEACFVRVHSHATQVLSTPPTSVLPDLTTIRQSESALLQTLPETGLGIEATTEHILQDIVPSLNSSSLSPSYYGFVTGGITPAARIGESIVSTYDQNVQVHLPDQSIATSVEDKALRMLMDLFNFDQHTWSGTFTTGATASNVVGLAMGREYTINQAIKRRRGSLKDSDMIGSQGLLGACRVAGIEDVLILTTCPHSSLMKAASIVGLGRQSVIDLSSEDDGLSFDFVHLETKMIEKYDSAAFIVVISCGEVNTGRFATDGLEAMQNLRVLCDRYGAWLHVDGAFGLFARLLDGTPGFEQLAKGAVGLELADSIAGDAHKLLNVPYDCGFIFSRAGPDIAEQVFRNAGASYLNASSQFAVAVRSPLNIGIENSRRFRSLPVYATLSAYGRDGYRDMLVRQVRLARAIALYILDQPAFELLPSIAGAERDRIDREVFMIVLFKARDDALNDSLVKRINDGANIYVSGTSWLGKPATRIAISNWQADLERDFERVAQTLAAVLESWKLECNGV